MDGVVGGSAGVHDAGGRETARSRGVWGIPGGWDTLRGSSGGSPGVVRRFGAAIGGPEWGRAGGWAVVDSRGDDDVAVALGGSCGTGFWGTSWGEQGATGRLLGLRLEFRGKRVCFVE
jgi:hypothetical protein